MKKKKVLIGLGVLVVVIAAMLLLWNNFREKPQEMKKEITLVVKDEDGKETEYVLQSEAVYLIDAMNEAKEQGFTYEGEDGAYDLSISKVNGVRADYNLDKAYWAFYVNGEYCNYGVSQQPVEDGDQFEIVYTKAW